MQLASSIEEIEQESSRSVQLNAPTRKESLPSSVPFTVKFTSQAVSSRAVPVQSYSLVAETQQTTNGRHSVYYSIRRCDNRRIRGRGVRGVNP